MSGRASEAKSARQRANPGVATGQAGWKSVGAVTMALGAETVLTSGAPHPAKATAIVIPNAATAIPNALRITQAPPFPC